LRANKEGKMKMRKSDYAIYQPYNDIVVIEDLNLGNRSVTNDIENILIELDKRIPTLHDMKIIYRDSMGIYDGIKIKDGNFHSFYSIQEKDLDKAINKAER
jgi:hypothetical protein